MRPLPPRKPGPLPGLLLASTLSLAAPMASAEVLGFDDAASLSEPGYGDVPGLLDLSHAYQLGSSRAPLQWWDAGYDDLRGVAWGPLDTAGAVGRITLLALDPSRPVVLNGFQLGSWETSGSGRIESVTVTRVGEDSPAFSFTGVIGAGNQATLFTPQLSSATGLVIEWTNPWWTAIDNLDVNLATAVPEPSAAALMLLGVGVFLLRRQPRPPAAEVCT